MTMKCVSCGEANLVRDTRDLRYTYKGETTIIFSVAGDYCPACGDSVHNAAESKRYSAAILAFNKEVNSATVEPAFICETRKKLNLDQREAAELFGGGANGFSRYETGKTRPSLALVQLLKILSNHPALIDEIREKQTEPPAATLAKNKLTRRKKALTTK
jgi:HTH-type transcriptional regulator/antitoxin MqsA